MENKSGNSISELIFKNNELKKFYYIHYVFLMIVWLFITGFLIFFLYRLFNNISFARYKYVYHLGGIITSIFWLGFIFVYIFYTSRKEKRLIVEKKELCKAANVNYIKHNFYWYLFKKFNEKNSLM